MTIAQQKNPLFSNKILLPAAILFSGLCWYISYGLTGDYWFLFWLAPIPVMILSFRLSGKAAFFIAFISYLIGRLSWFTYLVSVATMVPAVIFTIAPSLFFALLMLLTRRIVINSKYWFTVFAFPALWTSFEFLLIKFSADGTAASVAYSQLNMLPLIQIASITGILGITFIITFIPSAIAVAWHFKNERKKLQYVFITSLVLISVVFLFGELRLNSDEDKSNTKVGLVVVEEKLHNITDHPDAAKEIALTENYAGQIAKLAAQGAQVVVMAERAINITKDTDSAIMSILSNAAIQNHVVIVTGYTNFKNKPARNSALVINNNGKLIADYNKVHLVTGLESMFTPGKEIGSLDFNGIKSGVSICKDLDFPDYIRKYGADNAGCLFIPARDFVTDDWLHSRMAILRGVENGFSEVRTARQGRLTISDYYGKVNFETSCANGNAASLTGEVSFKHKDTFYNKYGDWFAVVTIVMSLGFIVIGFKKRS
ncbi:MAG: nitrilase-related carbon-nitrogen hydrolase [Panacibacter sp.]